MPSRKSLVGDRAHCEETHDRWARRFEQRELFGRSSTAAPVDGIVPQCMLCRYYVPLAGPLGEDWGACTNAASAHDSTIMFEHDGCAAFAPAEDFWQASPPDPGTPPT